jgi:hypothetical protein
MISLLNTPRKINLSHWKSLTFVKKHQDWMDDEGDVVDPLVIPKPILREAAAWLRLSWPVLGGAE